jgi:hypothetical protein
MLDNASLFNRLIVCAFIVFIISHSGNKTIQQFNDKPLNN